MQCSVLPSIPVIFDAVIQSPLPDINISAYPCCTLSFDSVIRLALRCTTEPSNIKPVNSRRCHILCFIHYALLHCIVDALNFNKSSLEDEPSLSLLGICSVWLVLIFFTVFVQNLLFWKRVNVWGSRSASKFQYLEVSRLFFSKSKSWESVSSSSKWRRGTNITNQPEMQARSVHTNTVQTYKSLQLLHIRLQKQKRNVFSVSVHRCSAKTSAAFTVASNP